MHTSLAVDETDDDRECGTASDPTVASPRGQHDGRSLASVAELIADHLRQATEAGGRTAKTTNSYESFARKWVVPLIGERMVASVRIQDIEAITDAMVLARRAPSSITHVKALLRGSFERARQLGLIEVSPMRGLDGRAGALAPTRSPEQAQPGVDDSLVAALFGAALHHPMTDLALRLTVALRLPRGELVRLQWSSVELTLRASHTGPTAGERLKLPIAAIGSFALDPTTSGLLRDIHAKRQEAGPWIISSDGGLTPWTAGHLSNRWALVRSRVPNAGAVRLGDLTRLGPGQKIAKLPSTSKPTPAQRHEHCPACLRPFDVQSRDLGQESRRASTVERRRFLTHREDAVAVLAARGLNNSAIAADLFVSVKAVEFHLTRVFRKMGIRNRTQLSILFGAASFDPQ